MQILKKFKKFKIKEILKKYFIENLIFDFLKFA